MVSKEDLEDSLQTIASVEYCKEALESLVKPQLDSLAHAILSANLSTPESQDKLILDKARYEGAKQVIANLMISLENVLKNG